MITPIREARTLIRGMTHEDLSRVSNIERLSYEFPWSHGVFRDCLLAGYHCSVLERNDEVASDDDEWQRMDRSRELATHEMVESTGFSSIRYVSVYFSRAKTRVSGRKREITIRHFVT